MSLWQKIAKIELSLFTVSKTVLIFVTIIVLIHSFLITIFVVDGHSMDATLADGQFLIVDRISYLTGTPKRGDIVVVRYPGDPKNVKYVKRIVGIPGDHLEIKNGKLYIKRPDFNKEKQLIEYYLESSITSQPSQIRDIGENEYFTMGDNRPVSLDSRYFGFVPRHDLIGKAIMIIYPFSKFSILPQSFYELSD